MTTSPSLAPSARQLTPVTILASSLAVVLFIAAAWMARENMRGIEISDALSDQAHSAQLAAETLLSTLKDAETGQRGYLLAGFPEYLKPYDSARARLSEDFASLERAPFRDAERARRIADIRELSARKLAELGLTISLWQSGQHQAALDVVRTNRGQQLMDAIRVEVAALQAGVQAKLTDARMTTRSPLVWSEIVGLAALGCLLLGWVIAVQNRAHRIVVGGFAQLKTFALALEDAKEQQQRASALLKTILETAPGLIYAKDEDGRMLLANAAALDLIGKSWAEVEGRTDRDFLADPAQGEAIMANDRRVMDTGQAEELEELVGGAGREERVWLSTKTPLRDPSGRVTGLVGVPVEITERKRVEERLRHMVNELNHRVRNTLATVQSIALQTLRGSDPAVRYKLEARLVALASAHDVLTRGNWERASLVEIITGVLAPYGGLEGGRFLVKGPRLHTIPRAAVALALALHELATNALKYGALSVNSGTVQILWEILPGEIPRFRLAWTESRGPVVALPTVRGFGTKLIERSLAIDLGGTAVMHFEPSGVICEIVAPLTEIAAPAEVTPFPRVGVM